jgi:hypothetical protein
MTGLNGQNVQPPATGACSLEHVIALDPFTVGRPVQIHGLNLYYVIRTVVQVRNQILAAKYNFIYCFG